MDRNVTHEVKVEMLRRAVQKCTDNGVPALRERLIAWAGAMWGTARQNAQGYLKELEGRELVYNDRGEMWTMMRWHKIELAREKDYKKMKDLIED